jgi:hypothetical protein
MPQARFGNHAGPVATGVHVCPSGSKHMFGPSVVSSYWTGLALLAFGIGVVEFFCQSGSRICRERMYTV